MKTHTATLGAAIIIAGLIQPCPAPFLALIPPTVAALAGGVALGAGAAAAGAAAANLKRDGLPPSGPPGSSSTGFAAMDQCMSEMLQGTWQYQYTSTSSMVFNDLPQSCISATTEYNSSPDIQSLNSMYGTAEVTNGSSVELNNLPPYMQSMISPMMYPATVNPVQIAPSSGAKVPPPTHGGAPPAYSSAASWSGHPRRSLRFDPSY